MLTTAIRILPFFLLFGCSPRIALQVGSFEVTTWDVRYRARYVKTFYPDIDPTEFARRQLTTAYSYAEILKRKGIAITSAALDAEARRIESDPALAEERERVRGVFGDDPLEYRRAYLLPRIAEREVYRSVYAVDTEIGRSSQIRAMVFLKDALASETPKGLAAVETAHGVSPYPMRISRERGTVEPVLDVDHLPPAHSPAEALNGIRLSETDPTKRWAADLVSPVADGKFVRRAQDVGTAWVVLRRIGRLEGGDFRVQLYSFPKRPFSEWIREQLLTVAIRRDGR